MSLLASCFSCNKAKTYVSKSDFEGVSSFYSKPSPCALSRRKQNEIKSLFSCRDLSSHQDLAEAILDCFSSPSEEIKSAASFALGSCNQDGYIKINSEITIEMKTKMRSRLGEY